MKRSTAFFAMLFCGIVTIADAQEARVTRAIDTTQVVSLQDSLLVTASVAAQQTAAPSNPADQADAPGRIAGHIVCSDTGKPARFASIQLMSEQSMKTPVIDPADQAASAGAKDGRSAAKGNINLDVDIGGLLSKAMDAMMKGSNLSAMTAMDGSFSLDKVPPGTYYINPEYRGYLSPLGRISGKERLAAGPDTLSAIEQAAQKIVVAPGSTTNLEIQIERGAAIDGVVHYDDGSPAPNVAPVLMVLGKDGKWKELAPADFRPSATDDQGHYRFSGLPAGKYAVKATLPTVVASMGIGAGSLTMHFNTGDALVVYSGNALWIKDVKPIELAPGDTRNDVDVSFPTDGLYVVSGSVVAKSDGHPVNAGSVELRDPFDKTVTLRSAKIGKGGSFQFNYVPGGTYRLEVTGAADTETAGAADGDANNSLAMLLNGSKAKSLRKYGETGLTVTLPGNSDELTLQVPDAAGDKTPR